MTTPQYYAAHKAELKGKHRDWVKAHPDNIRSSNRKYQRTHRDKCRIWEANYRQKHRDEIRNRNKERYPMHKDEMIARSTKYYREHKEERHAYLRERRRQLRQRFFDIYGHKCSCLCGCTEDRDDFLTIGHLKNNGCDDRRQNGNYGVLCKAVNHPDHEQYGTLCYGCNMAAAANGGTCPAIKVKKKETLAINMSATD